jgi:hypothetical protein
VASHVAAPASGPSGGEPPRIEGARLQTDARDDLASLRREKKQRLETYGRVDADHMHIPIERAMQILAKERRR